MPSQSNQLEELRRENEKLQRSVAELSVLNDLAVTIATAKDLEEVTRTIVQRSLRAVGAQQGVVTLVDEDSTDPMRTLIRTTTRTTLQEELRPDEHLLGWMQYHKSALIINDPHHDSRFAGTSWDPNIRAVLSVPMMTQGRLIGILTLYKKVDGGFDKSDQRLLSIIGAQSAKVVENAHLHDERNSIYQLFGQHTSPAIVEKLLREGPETESTRRHVCVMFLDIRGFTTYAEERSPEEVVAYLNTLFGFMIDLVNENGGIIHQLLGDGFMAIFGAPVSTGNDSQNAVEASLAILDRVETEMDAGTVPETRIGIGLHAGVAVAGNVGSDIHKEYKITGDVVNLAARIEQLTKTYDSQLLVSEAVWNELQPGRFTATLLENVDVRGRTGTVHLYSLA